MKVGEKYRVVYLGDTFEAEVSKVEFVKELMFKLPDGYEVFLDELDSKPEKL